MFGRKNLERAVKAEALSESRKEQLDQAMAFHNEANAAWQKEMRASEEKLRDLNMEIQRVLSNADELMRDRDVYRRKSEERYAVIEALNARMHELDKKNAILLERLDLMANYGFTSSSGPKVMPEEAEDALFAHKAGLIDTKELENVLEQSGFENSEIEFASEFPRGDYPRLST